MGFWEGKGVQNSIEWREEKDDGSLLFFIMLCYINRYLTDVACGIWDTQLGEEW
jgi:hypothetical protein